MYFTRPFALALTVLALAVATKTANATVIYTYSGNDFTLAIAPYTTSDFISASFTFANPPPNTNTNEAANVITWSMTDQVITNNAADSTLEGASFYVQNGQILAWQFYAFGSGTCPPPSIANDCGAHIVSSLGIGGGTYDETYGLVGSAYNLGDPGTWQESASGSSTPEPSTTVLALLGGALLLIAMRQKRDGGVRL